MRSSLTLGYYLALKACYNNSPTTHATTWMNCVVMLDEVSQSQRECVIPMTEVPWNHLMIETESINGGCQGLEGVDDVSWGLSFSFIR